MAGRAGSGRGRGRGFVPGEPNNSETTDMDWGAENPFSAGAGARKRLIGVDGSVNLRARDNSLNSHPGKVATQVQLLENGNAIENGEKSDTTPQKVQPPKRQRKGVNGEETEEFLGSATSALEDRRDQ
jgi:hypothetical protein